MVGIMGIILCVIGILTTWLGVYLNSVVEASTLNDLSVTQIYDVLSSLTDLGMFSKYILSVIIAKLWDFAVWLLILLGVAAFIIGVIYLIGFYKSAFTNNS